jgi:hypothetical protein
MHTVRLIVCGLFISVISSVSFAETKPTSTDKHYRINVNTSLLPSANSTVGLGHLTLDLYTCSTYPVQLLNDHFLDTYPAPTKLATLALGLVHANFIMIPLSIAYHEFGHARGLMAFDRNSDPYYYCGNPNITSASSLSSLLAGNTYYHMLGHALVKTPGGFVLPKSASETINRYYLDCNQAAFIEKVQSLIDSPTIDQITIWAGGFNNQAILASLIEDTALMQNGYHLFDSLALAFNKFTATTVIYPSKEIPYTLKGPELLQYDHFNLMLLMNDHGSIQRHYRMKNIINNYDPTMSNTGCLLSFFLSSSTYESLYGIYNYVYNGHLFTEPFNYKGFYLPNTSFFFTSQGLSLRFKTAYRWDPTLLLMATYEMVYKGKNAHELKVTAFKTLPQFYNVQLTLGALASTGTADSFATQGNIGIKVPVSNNFNIEAAYYLWNKNTLDGERNISSTDKSSIDHEIIIGISGEF